MTSETYPTRKSEAPNTPIEIRIKYLNAVHNYLMSQKEDCRLHFEHNWTKLVSSRDRIQLTTDRIPPYENESLEIQTRWANWKREVGGPGVLYEMNFNSNFTGVQPLSLSDFQAYFTDIGIESKREVLGVDHQKLEVDLKGDHYSFYPTALKKGKISIHLSLPGFAGHWLDEHRFAGRVHRLENRKTLKQTLGDFGFMLGKIIDYIYISAGETPSFDSLTFSPYSIRFPHLIKTAAIVNGQKVENYDVKEIAKPIEDIWRGYEGAKCSHCGSVYKTNRVRVFEEKLQIVDPTCEHCGASTPILIEE